MYAFYGGLIEEGNFVQYHGAFLDALGDLPRYWMAVCALLEGIHTTSNTLTTSMIPTVGRLFDVLRGEYTQRT